MGCCRTRGAEPFTDATARRDLGRLRRRGLDTTAKRLADAVAAPGETVLEVGGGVGGLHVELLRRGAERATNVELSPAYEDAAAELLRAAGLADRVERRIGDFAALEVPAADVVVMHRVVCCSPDVDGLVGAAADHARRRLALSFPRDAWWLRVSASALNLGARALRWEWRFYVHPSRAIAAAAEARGLRPAAAPRGRLWQVAAFDRHGIGTDTSHVPG